MFICLSYILLRSREALRLSDNSVLSVGLAFSTHWRLSRKASGPVRSINRTYQANQAAS